MRSSAIQGVQTDLRKQLAYPKVAQPKLAAYSAPSVLLVSSTHPARMTDSPAKRPGGSLLFVVASHQTRLDTRSKARRPIKVGIKGRGKSGTSQDSSPAGQCCWSAHLVQCELDEASSFTNPNVGPGTYASLRLKLDTWSSAVHGWQRRQKCSSPTRRLPSRSWGPIRAPSLLLVSSTHPARMPDGPAKRLFICRCLPPDTTWHKVKSPKAD